MVFLVILKAMLNLSFGVLDFLGRTQILSAFYNAKCMKIYSLKQCSWGNRCLILICVTIMDRCLSLMYLLLHRFP